MRLTFTSDAVPDAAVRDFATTLRVRHELVHADDRAQAATTRCAGAALDG
jgi:hypothetical protein